jgi:hypothetical protein
MKKEDFEAIIKAAFNEANENEVPIDQIYDVLNRHTLIAKTVLEYTIVQVYKERFK